METPLNQRPNNIFLSHSSRDKLAFVDGLYDWLTKQAGLSVWYDANLGSGPVDAHLDQAIDSSKAAVVVLSENSAQSPWVSSECSRLQEEAARLGGDFRIATVRLDGADAPGLLKSFKHIDVGDGWSAGAAALLLDTLFAGKESGARNTVYLSRGWHAGERQAASKICAALQTFGLRIVCDWTDHAEYKIERVSDIIEGAGGLVAIVPHRGKGQTSKYFASEVELARRFGIPVLIFAHNEVKLPAEWADLDPIVFDDTLEKESASSIAERFANPIELFAQNWRRPPHGGYIFLGHSLETSISTQFRLARGMLSRVTGLPVEVGGLVSGQEAQPEIVNLIRGADLCVVDLTNSVYPNLPEKIDFALNSSIEAGIALGSGTKLYITCRGRRRSPPFMFRNKQIWYYEDELELIGKLYQIAVRHRRMVL